MTTICKRHIIVCIKHMKGLSKNRIRILKLFYRHSQKEFYMQELGRALKKKPGVFQRTLNNMVREGILSSRYTANIRYFRLNPKYFLYRELKSIVAKSFKLLLILIFLVSAFGQKSEAAEIKLIPAEGPVLSLKLDDAIITAYNSNKDIQIQEQQVSLSRAQILGARSNFLPKVDLNAGYTYNSAVLGESLSSVQIGKKDIGVYSGYKNDNTLGVTFTEEIYKGGANIAEFNQSKINLRIQEETLRAKKLDIEFETQRLYYGLLLSYETERIMKGLLAQAEAHYLNVRSKFQQGTASRFDVLQSKVHVATIVPEAIKAENAIYLIKAELKKLLDLAMEDRLDLIDKLTYSEINIDESKFLSQAYLDKPEMVLKALGVDIKKWSIQMARANGRLKVLAQAGYSYRSDNWNNMFNQKHNIWSAGVSLSMPIFDGFYTKAKVEAAKARYQQAILSKEDMALQVAVNVKRACLDLIKSEAIIISQRDSVYEAQEALKISEISYDNGVGINLDVLDAQVALSQIERNLSEATYDYLMAEAFLNRTRGKEIVPGLGGDDGPEEEAPKTVVIREIYSPQDKNDNNKKVVKKNAEKN